MFERALIEEVRNRTDLAELVGQYVPLRKTGGRFVARCPFHDERTPSFSVSPDVGLYFCLAGDTRVITWSGVRPIRELAGDVHRVLTQHGRWVDAPFRSFGVQPLLKVTLSRNGQTKVIHATPEHRWFVRRTKKRTTTRAEKTTATLRCGDAMSWSFAQNRVKAMGGLSPFGVAHGIAFADGTIGNNMCLLDLHGWKKDQLAKWFPLNETCEVDLPDGGSYLRVSHLPLYFKSMPSIDEAPSYLAGFIAGYLSTDGHVAKDGTVMLHSADRRKLEFVRDICTRLGVGTYGITSQMRVGIGATEATELFRVHFINEDVDERMLLRDEQRERFCASQKATTRRGWVVKSVEETGRVEEVFCATVDDTHNFTLEDNILTGNCFGCKASGDVLRFYEQMEGVTFPEALRALAERAGVDLPDERDPQRIAEDRRQRDVGERLHAVCEAAAVFYAECLREDPFSELARGALEERGVTDETVERFRLGYAPAQWDALAQHLKEKRFSPADGELAGLLLPGRGGYYDRFRHRLMFPVLDRSGKVVAFSGRVLPLAEGMPEGICPPDAGKYVNSPETPIYHKGELLYGLSNARTAMRHKAEAVLVEGNFDVVQMHQHGFAETVAPLGTSFTDAQAKLLRRFAETVVLVFDGDEAGKKAARAAHPVCAKARILARVADLPSGSDPDAFLRSDEAGRGRAGMAAALKGGPGVVEWIIRDIGESCGDSVPERVAAARAAARVIADVADPIERDEYVRLVALTVCLDEKSVQQALAEVPRDVRARSEAPDEPRRRPALRNPEGSRGELDAVAQRRRRAVANGIEAVLLCPPLLASEAAGAFEATCESVMLPVVVAARAQWAATGKLDGAALMEACPEVARPWLAARLMPPEEEVPELESRCASVLADAVADLRGLGAMASQPARATAASETEAHDSVVAARRVESDRAARRLN